MKNLINSILENNLTLEIPAEYSEYLCINPGKIAYHDPENEEQAAIATKMKMKQIAFFMIFDIPIIIILIYVIVTKNKLIVILLMALMAIISITQTIRVISKKLKVVTGRAVIKTKHYRHNKNYSYYVAVAVDEPEKTIYPNISISKSDYEKIQEGTKIMIVNISSPGSGVVLD